MVRTVAREEPLPSFSTTVPDTQAGSDPQPWLGELMNSVREMRGLLTDQTVTRHQFKQYHVEYSDLIVLTIEEAAAPIKQELEEL